MVVRNKMSSASTGLAEDKQVVEVINGTQKSYFGSRKHDILIKCEISDSDDTCHLISMNCMFIYSFSSLLNDRYNQNNHHINHLKVVINLCHALHICT